MKRYLVIKNWITNYPNPIRVLKGEIVECLKDEDEQDDWKGWVFCKTVNNEGWIPQQIIERNINKGTILESYDAIELNLTIGEKLIEERILNGWVWCYKEVEPQKKGWAPLNHIEILE